MKELLSLIRGLIGILLIGYIGAILWNILVYITPLRIWYRPTPLTPAYWVSGFIFMLCFGGPVMGLIAMGTIESSFANEATVPTYIAMLCLGIPCYLWGMRQETLHREGRPNALTGYREYDGPGVLADENLLEPMVRTRGKVRTREEAIAHLNSMSPEERREWEAVARKYQDLIRYSRR